MVIVCALYFPLEGELLPALLTKKNVPVITTGKSKHAWAYLVSKAGYRENLILNNI